MTRNFLMNSIRLAALAAVSLVPSMACSYSASAPAVGAGGGNIAVQIDTQAGCQWQVTPGDSWMDIVSSHTGYGTGTVYVYVAPHNGVRQGDINVWAATGASPTLGGRSSPAPIVIVARALVTQY